jgi:hypothetical protein
MRPEQVLVADAVALLLLLTLAAVTMTGKARLCHSYVVYLVAALATNRLVTWWPERFFTQGFWRWKELAFAVLVVAVAAELVVVGLAGFARARQRAVASLAALGLGLVYVVGTAVVEASDYRDWMGGVVATARTGTAWSLVILLTVVSWYRLPMRPWHRMIAIGFILHGGVYSILLGAVGRFGWAAYPYLEALDPTAYAATVGLWAYAAWQVEWGDLPLEAQERLAGR